MHNPYHARKNGFTLLEILVVIAIIGILAGIAAPAIVGNIRRANLAEAAATVYAELYRARSTAQRKSVDQPVSWTATSLSAGAGRSVDLPNGARIVTPSATGYTYTAPYGEFTDPSSSTGAGGLRLELVDASGQYHTAVDAVGVTGKVLRRQVVAMSTPIP